MELDVEGFFKFVEGGHILSEGQHLWSVREAEAQFPGFSSRRQQFHSVESLVAHRPALTHVVVVEKFIFCMVTLASVFAS